MRNEAGQYAVRLPKKGAGLRRLVLAPDIVLALQRHLREEHRRRRAPAPGDFVFTAGSGNHVQPRHLDRTFRALTRDAGLPRIRFHDLRHTAASLLIRQGVPAKVVAALPLDVLLGASAERSAALSPESVTDAQRGADALRTLHAALGNFLRQAPAWAQEVAFAGLARRPAAVTRRR
ncbi:hypothetical protein GCM10010841_32310 [Deinococcus aerophilus]|uniref:Tyr recombinase domain-containing protein n=1 Tax=Deinococcus aerophilus TaxID=522488 RepID=A0ABQ2H1D4_9DEIO|nr:hypothetical protein GCM10010841_32310 [Deinococcus aerophilus]